MKYERRERERNSGKYKMYVQNFVMDPEDGKYLMIVGGKMRQEEQESQL